MPITGEGLIPGVGGGDFFKPGFFGVLYAYLFQKLS